MKLVCFVTGVTVGWATSGLFETYAPLAINAAAHLWGMLGLGYFMLIFGALAAVMIWAFDRW